MKQNVNNTNKFNYDSEMRNSLNCMMSKNLGGESSSTLVPPGSTITSLTLTLTYSKFNTFISPSISISIFTFILTFSSSSSSFSTLNLTFTFIISHYIIIIILFIFNNVFTTSTGAIQHNYNTQGYNYY